MQYRVCNLLLSTIFVFSFTKLFSKPMYHQENHCNGQGQKQKQSDQTSSRGFVVDFIVSKTFWVRYPAHSSGSFDA